MECTTLQEDVLYSQNTSKLTPESIAAIQNTVQRSQPVGVVAGLYDEAVNAANEAKKWSLIGIIAGLVIQLIWCGVYGYAAFASL